jgi:hypothetical protein
MRFSQFQQIRDVPARFLSEAPLFDFTEGAQPLPPGHYALAGEATLVFAFDEDHYRMTGGAPETVALIPVAAHPGIYVFQQSEGYGIAFYGLLRLNPGDRGFDLFSPEPLGLQAVDLAISQGGVATDLGCAFGDPDMLLLTLLQLGLSAPAGIWDTYRRA